jgi:transketolase
MNTFGASAPLKDLLIKFGFTAEKVEQAARAQIRGDTVAAKRTETR